MAVKKGVVAPIAWLNETGKYLKDVFPHTTEKEKIKLNEMTLTSCWADEMYCLGTIPSHATAA
mgnify:CR=1 FL=1